MTARSLQCRFKPFVSLLVVSVIILVHNANAMHRDEDPFALLEGDNTPETATVESDADITDTAPNIDVPVDSSTQQDQTQESTSEEETTSTEDTVDQKEKLRASLIEEIKAVRDNIDLAEAHKHEAILDLTSAEEELNLGKKKLEAVGDSRTYEAELKKTVQEKLDSIKLDMPLLEEHLHALLEEKLKYEKESSLILEEYHAMILDYKLITNKTKSIGLEHWVHAKVGSSPVLEGAILKTSHRVVEPVFNGINRAVNVNKRLSDRVSHHMEKYYGSETDSRFFKGIIFYITLLFPLVITVSLLRHAYIQVTHLTLRHYILYGNMYFFSLSFVCFLMTLILGNDVLAIFRFRSEKFFEAFIIIHGCIYFIYVIIHAMSALLCNSLKQWSQLAAILCAGFHCFQYCFKKAVLNDYPVLGVGSYLVYSFLASLIVLERLTQDAGPIAVSSPYTDDKASLQSTSIIDDAKRI